MTIHSRPRHGGAKRTLRRAMAYLRWICRSAGPNGRSTHRVHDHAVRACPACYYVE